MAAENAASARANFIGDLLQRIEPIILVAMGLLFAALLLADPVSEFRAELARNPKSADAAFNLALALLQADRAGEALATLDRHPHALADHHRLRGSILNVLGRTTDAAQALGRSVAADPDNPDALYDLVVTLLRLERNKEASALLDKARPRFASVAKIHAISGMVAYAAGRNADAIRFYEAAVKIEPAADLWAALGDVYDATGELAKSESAHARAVKLEPASAEYAVKHGRVLAKLQRAADAESAFARAVRLEPANADAHFQLGKLLAARGDTAAAIGHWERAVGAQPGLKEAWYQLGIAYRRAGREAESQEAMRRFRE
jgi:tetratricopeptide (TPR) repeat protein